MIYERGGCLSPAAKPITSMPYLVGVGQHGPRGSRTKAHLCVQLTGHQSFSHARCVAYNHTLFPCRQQHLSRCGLLSLRGALWRTLPAMLFL
jgi:hypothetical protein